MHKIVQPKVFYFGTPVVLISTINPDGSPNLAPMSSAWWVNQSCMLGMSYQSQTVQNLIREKSCVLNLPSAQLVNHVDRLALTTGKEDIPMYKATMGYTYEPNKFECAGLTAIPADLVQAPLVQECPIQLEAQVEQISTFSETGTIAAIELRMIRVHVEESILVHPDQDYIDPEKWHPLIMNYCEFFGLGAKLQPSRLAEPFMAQYHSKG